MNEAIQQGTKCVKTLQDENSQLKINMDNAESQHRSERATQLKMLKQKLTQEFRAANDESNIEFLSEAKILYNDDI